MSVQMSAAMRRKASPEQDPSKTGNYIQETPSHAGFFAGWLLTVSYRAPAAAEVGPTADVLWPLQKEQNQGCSDCKAAQVQLLWSSGFGSDGVTSRSFTVSQKRAGHAASPPVMLLLLHLPPAATARPTTAGELQQSLPAPDLLCPWKSDFRS